MVMKRILHSVFLALFVFAISGFAQTQPQQAAPEEVWKEFSSAAGRFKVLIPGNPTKTSTTLEYRFRTFRRHTFSSWAGYATFLVAYSDIPVTLAEPEDIEEFLDHHMHENEVAASQEELLSKTVIELDGYPGRELIVETPKSTIRMKYYLVGQRLYQIAASTMNAGALDAEMRRHEDDLEKKGEKDLAKKFRENFPFKSGADMARSFVFIADEFFASFKLTGKPGMGKSQRLMGRR
jgi:hypothetical protein